MPQRKPQRSFTLGPKRKRSRAELRSRTAAPSPAAACEKCGEGDSELGDVQLIQTVRGPEMTCYLCRCAHFQRVSGLLKPTKISFEERGNFEHGI